MAAASGQATSAGISEANTENAAMAVIASRVVTSQRDGLQSRRQGADALDERVECVIGRTFTVEEPAPEPIVLAVQQL